MTDDRVKTRNLRPTPGDPPRGLEGLLDLVAVEGTAESTPVAADPHDATVEELITYYRGTAASTPTGTSTARRW